MARGFDGRFDKVTPRATVSLTPPCHGCIPHMKMASGRSLKAARHIFWLPQNGT